MKTRDKILQVIGGIVLGLALAAMVLGFIAMGGCSSANVREERNEQVPGEAWYLEIDTRPAPAPQAMLPVHRALVMAAMGLPDEPTKVPIKVTAPDGSEVLLPADFPGVLRFGSAKGEDASAAAPPDGGGSAYAKATTIIGSRIKAPAKGVALILVGGLLVAAGVFCGFSKWLTVRSAVGLSLAGGACLACGWLIDSPIAGWLIGLAIVGGLVVLGLYIMDSKGKVDGDLTLKAVVPVIQKASNADAIKADIATVAGANLKRVKATVSKIKQRNNVAEVVTREPAP